MILNEEINGAFYEVLGAARFASITRLDEFFYLEEIAKQYEDFCPLKYL